MIGSRIINPVSPSKALPRPLIIAEAGVNHEGSLEIAKRLVREAAEGGADAIKFQTYRADTHSPRFILWRLHIFEYFK